MPFRFMALNLGRILNDLCIPFRLGKTATFTHTFATLLNGRLVARNVSYSEKRLERKSRARVDVQLIAICTFKG